MPSARAASRGGNVVLRPETELLLSCARPRLGGAAAERCRSLVRLALDWGMVVDQARRHGVDPLLYRHLAAIDEPSIPAWVRDRLRLHFETNAVRNRLLTAELSKVLAQLADANVAAIPYKGPVLARTAYGDVALRRFADLDVLVRRADVRRAVAALGALGYEPRLRLTRAQERAFLGFHCEYPLDRARGRLTTEIHWDVVPREFAFDLDLDRFWSAARPIEIDGVTALTPLPEDLLLILVVHGAKHFWARLAWVVDVAAVIEAHPEMDWTALLARARERGAARMLGVALTVVTDLLGVGVPPRVSEQIAADPTTAALSTRVTRWIDGAPIPAERSLGALRASMALRERRRDRVTHLWRTALTPTIEDWASIPLPAPLMPLHYLLRPFRLAAKRGAMLLKSGDPSRRRA
jgi:hypothetical protein